jgi:hypothetical protein
LTHTEEELLAVLAVRNDPKIWIERNLWIRTKERQLARLELNAVQQLYYNQRTSRDIILKSRQVGITTGVCGLFFPDTVLRPNTASAIVGHDQESSERIFSIVRLMWKRMPEPWHERYPTRLANKGELEWPALNSRFFVGTAGAPAFGRGQTINNLLCSELSHWPQPEEALAALLEAVPAGGRVVIESTPNGLGNHFHSLWLQAQNGESGFKPFFFPWFADPAYRCDGPPLGELTADEMAVRAAYGLDDAQIRWRREKQRQLRDKFPQEYPEDDVTCFLTSGRCIFSVPGLLKAQEHARLQPSRQHEMLTLKHRWGDGSVTEKGPVNVLPGRLTIWHWPEEGRHYSIGADVSEGLEGGDYSAGVVLDWKTGKQVAELHGLWRPDVFAKLLAALGALYRWAWIGVESNNLGYTTLHVLRNELFYTHLYYYVEPVRGAKPHLGWPTNARTKAILVNDLAAAIADGNIEINSLALIGECLTFVSKDGGVREAQDGKFDDRVIAAGVALQVRKRCGPRRFSYERPAGW